jgi:hypothetical protein
MNYRIMQRCLYINKRFPHLNMMDVMRMEKEMCHTKDTVQVHGGVYTLTHRQYMSDNQCFLGDGRSTFMSWDCCHHIRRDGIEPQRRDYPKPFNDRGYPITPIYYRSSLPINNESVHINPYPLSKCDHHTTFTIPHHIGFPGVEKKSFDIHPDGFLFIMDI